MRFIMPKNLNNAPNSIHTDWELKMDNWCRSFGLLISLWPSVKVKVILTTVATIIIPKFEPNLFINVQMHANVKLFWHSQQNSTYFPWLQKLWLKSSIRIIHLNCAQKWSRQALPCTDPVTPGQGQGHQIWHKMKKSMVPISMVHIKKFGWNACA